MVLVAALVLIQGVGILAVHGHLYGMADHLHQFMVDGDDHVGHVDDLAYSEAGHGDATDSAAPRGPAASLIPALAGVLAVATVVLSGLMSASRHRWAGRERWRPPRLQLTILAVLQV